MTELTNFLVLAVVFGLLGYLYRQRARSRPGNASGTTGSSRDAKLFRTGFERSPVAAGYIGVHDSWLQVNSKLLLLLGYGRDEFVRTSLRTITHPDDRKKEAKLMAELRSGQTSSYSINKRLRRGNGEFRMYRVDLIRCSESGSPSCYLCVVSEVTDLADRIEQIVRAFDDVAEISVTRIDVAGNIVRWNRGAERLFGYHENEIAGTPWMRLQKSGHSSLKPLAVAGRDGYWRGMESRVCRDGSLVTLTATIFPLQIGKEITGFVEFCRDMSADRATSEATIALDRIKAISEEQVAGFQSSLESFERDRGVWSEQEAALRRIVQELTDRNAELLGRLEAREVALFAYGDRENADQTSTPGLDESNGEVVALTADSPTFRSPHAWHEGGGADLLDLGAFRRRELDSSERTSLNSEASPGTVDATERVIPARFVSSASGRSKKYHLDECRALRGARSESMVTFDSRDDAEARGFQACRRCLGAAAEPDRRSSPKGALRKP